MPRCAPLPTKPTRRMANNWLCSPHLRIAAEYDLLRRKLDGGVSDSSMSNHSSECDGWENKMPEGEERETCGQGVRLMTEEDRQRTRERRERHHTKRWYEKQLSAIANGELNLTKDQHKALIAFGRTRG